MGVIQKSSIIGSVPSKRAGGAAGPAELVILDFAAETYTVNGVSGYTFAQVVAEDLADIPASEPLVVTPGDGLSLVTTSGGPPPQIGFKLIGDAFTAVGSNDFLAVVEWKVQAPNTDPLFIIMNAIRDSPVVPVALVWVDFKYSASGVHPFTHVEQSSSSPETNKIVTGSRGATAFLCRADKIAAATDGGAVVEEPTPQAMTSVDRIGFVATAGFFSGLFTAALTFERITIYDLDQIAEEPLPPWSVINTS